MNAKILVSTAMAAVLAAAAMPASAVCITTADVRGLNAQGGADVVRVTNQSGNQVDYNFQVRYLSGNTLGGGFTETLDPFESIALKVNEIFSRAGAGPLANLALWIPQRVITIEDNTQVATPQFNATILNYQTKNFTPLLITCQAP